MRHMWGEENFDWEGLNDAIDYLWINLTRWGRINVMQAKEKFGEVRVYCSFGWGGIYGIFYPGYAWTHTWWPRRLDQFLWYTLKLGRVINWIVIPIQQRIYRYFYRRATEKWPHLYEEIVASADWGELFEGYIPRYKHSDYWKEVK